MSRYIVILKPTEFADEIGYTVEVPALPGCITEGDTVVEALANSREAITVFLETLIDLGRPIPVSDETVSRRISDEVITSVEIELP